jgi:hypothetical protein
LCTLSTVNNNIIIFVLQIIGSGLCVYLCTLSRVNNNIIIFVLQIIGSGLCVYLCALFARNWRWKVRHSVVFVIVEKV